MAWKGHAVSYHRQGASFLRGLDMKKAPPDRGRANKELVQLLAVALELKPEQVLVVRGQTSRDKTVRLMGASCDELERRLLALVEATQA